MARQGLKNIEMRIEKLRRRLAQTGNMRPGTLGVQYRNPAEREKPFFQLSYTRKGKSRSEYVRAENLKTIRKEIDTYKRFKSTLEQLVELSIEASRLRCASRGASRRFSSNQSPRPKCT